MGVLPKVEIRGKPYYRDDRLREFRAVDNPHDRIPFADLSQSERQTIDLLLVHSGHAPVFEQG